jgi:hypothetical protein
MVKVDKASGEGPSVPLREGLGVACAEGAHSCHPYYAFFFSRQGLAVSPGLILLPHSPKCWDYRRIPPCSAHPLVFPLLASSFSLNHVALNIIQLFRSQVGPFGHDQDLTGCGRTPEQSQQASGGFPCWDPLASSLVPVPVFKSFLSELQKQHVFCLCVYISICT